MPYSTFNAQPTLQGDNLLLRPLQAEDFAALYSAASDPLIWAGHPAQDRHQREVFAPYFQFTLASGGALLIVDRHSGEVIGSSSYYPVPDQPEGVGIGFTFLRRDHWGGSSNRELKALMLEHAFGHFPTVWLHIAPSNLRSQKASAKIGAVFAYEAELNLSTVPVLWRCYRLDRPRRC